MLKNDNVFQFANENFSFYNSRIDSRMTDEAAGLVYTVQPSLQDIQNGVILFDPSQHSQLWAYVTIGGNTFTNQPDLADLDLDILEWDEHSMGVWPFGTPIPDEVKELRGALASLEELDSFHYGPGRGCCPGW